MVDESNNTKSAKPKEPSETIGVVVPYSLFQRVEKLANKHGYSSNSEFGREAMRKYCFQLEKADLGLEIWEMLGSKLVNEFKQEMESKIANLERLVQKYQQAVTGIEKEKGMLDDLPELDKKDAEDINDEDDS